MHALNEFGEIPNNVLKSLEAGCDSIFICNNRNKVINIIDELVIKSDTEVSNKLIKLNKRKIEYNFQKNKRRLAIIG